MKETLSSAILSFALLVVSIPNSYSQNNCMECHGEPDFAKWSESGDSISLFVDISQFNNSAHGGFDCIDCHTDAVGDPHPEKLQNVNCALCHEESQQAFLEGIHGKHALQGDVTAPTCSSCHTTHQILSSEDEHSSTYPINLPQTCGACHRSGGVAAARDLLIDKPYEKFEHGVHGRALLDGNFAAASCNSCHESHRLLPKSDPRSPIFRMNISHTCGKCHSDVTEVYDASVHGKALQQGDFNAPTCTNCHGEHEIQSPSEPTAPTYTSHIAEQTCSPCHGLLKLNEKYGILPDPVASYRNSYHGLASLRGSKVAANCTSCHGVHNILSTNDPNSSIHPANLVKTCGHCHVNATQEFAKSYIHATPESFEDRLAAVVKEIYIYLIVLVIGGMLLHNFIIWLKFVRLKHQALKSSETIQRFDRSWVIQHVTIFITFSILVVTGFALKFPDMGWVKILTFLGLTEHIRGVVHRVAAVGMLTAGVYHLYCLFLKKSWKGEIGALLPVYGDVKLFLQNMKFHLGIAKERPAFKRYGYIEKAEYWALVWGTVIMAITGFVLWFPAAATIIFPAWIVKLSETIHYYEAWLATLAIVFYHMFFAIFHPEDYPINLTGFTGKMHEEEVKERFPAWFEKLKAKAMKK